MNDDNNEDDLVENLNNDLPQLRITKNDLARPTRAFIMNYYSAMLEQVTRLQNNSFFDYTADQREHLRSAPEGPTLADHATCLNLFLSIKYLFENIHKSIPFHYSDIYMPFLSPNRSRVFMKSLYMLYATCAKVDWFYDLDIIENKKAFKLQLQEEQSRLQHEIILSQKKKEEYHGGDSDLKKQLLEYKKSSDEDQQIFKELQEEEQRLSEDLLLQQENENKLQEQFAKLDNEIKYYESLKVNDDGQIIETKNVLIKKNDECFAKLKGFEQKVQQLSMKDNLFDSVLNSYATLNDVLRDAATVGSKNVDIKELKNLSNVMKKDLKILDKEEEDIQGQTTEKKEGLASLGKDLFSREEKLKALEKVLKEEEEKNMGVIRDLQVSLSENCGRNNEVDAKEAVLKTDELNNLIKRFEEKLNTSVSTFNTTYQEMNNELNDILQHFTIKVRTM